MSSFLWGEREEIVMYSMGGRGAGGDTVVDSSELVESSEDEEEELVGGESWCLARSLA